MEIDLWHSSFSHLSHALALALALPLLLLQHASETYCIVLGLVIALDLLAALSLPHAVAQYGAIDSPAVVDCIGYFTWQFTLLQEVIAYAGSNSHYYGRLYFILTMRGDPADPLTTVRSLRDYVNYIIMLCKL
jgi:hypothetical protein